MILIFFIVGFVFADKLDRTYLPPPGSQFSGGSPGAIDVPLKHPKLHSFTNNEYFNPAEVAIGINRVAPKRPVAQDIHSLADNPSLYPGNTFNIPTTVNPYTQNTVISSKNGYSTVRPIYHSSNYSNDFQNTNDPKNLSNNLYQFQYTSDSNANQFQATENYPQLFPVDTRLNDFPNGLLSNQTKFHGNKNIIVNDISQTSPSSQLATDLINNKYSPGQYSSSPIPTVHANTNLISSTVSPSTVNYDYGTTIGPEEFYTSTLKAPQFPTSTPIDSKISPLFNYDNINKRPERIQAQADREASILNYESSISPEGYAYSYDTSNGIHADESGVTVNGVKAKGSYSYIGDDGKLYSVNYTADEYGFHPRGDHLPTSPPIPDAILKVIEQVTKEKEAGIMDDGSYDENKYGYRKYHNGFYSPKSGFTKVHSTFEENDKLTKNNNNINKIYSGGMRNQATNKNNKELNINENVVKNTNTIPAINSYLNTANNLENLGSQYRKQPNESHNKTEIQGVGSYDATDLATGDDASRSPSDSFKQAYLNPIINDEISQLVDKQTSVDNEEKYNDFGHGHTEENKPNKYSNKDTKTEIGYQYNPPQYTGNNEFPPRFSDIYNKQKTTLTQENSNKITPKPFLTPYVSETSGDNGKPVLNLESDYYDEELTQNNKYPSYFDSDLSVNDGYNRTDFSNIKTDNDSIRKFHQTKDGEGDPQTVKDGYYYQQGTIDSDKTSYDPFVADRHFYTSSTSTVVPTAFTSRINTNQPKDNKYNVGTPQTSIGSKSVTPSTTYIPNMYQTNLQFNKTRTLPNYSTIQPGFTNQREGNILSDTKLSYSADISTTPSTEFLTNIPIIGNSYAPNLDITHSDEYNIHPTTGIIFGEDFSGPKQPQRYDPVTGYYYK